VAPGRVHKVRELRRAISVAGEKAVIQPQGTEKALVKLFTLRSQLSNDVETYKRQTSPTSFSTVAP
jgi:hypothetical protein